MNKREFRILITENCNADCRNCFNKEYREDKYIKLDKLNELFEYLSNNGVKKLKIMGGEPTVHPQFEEVISLAQKYFEEIIIFTNALNDKIKNISPREKDSIIYNFNFVDEKFDCEKLLLDKNGIRAFEIQINYDSNLDKYKKSLLKLKETMHDKKQINIYLTLDCTEKIFKYRESIINNWNIMTDFIINNLGIEPYQDHIIPVCFYDGSKMKIKRISNQCNVLCSGLIDSNIKLRYCNQHPIVLGDLDTNSNFTEILKLLEDEYAKKMDKKMATKCGKCKNFLVNCNGGCFEKN